MDGRLLRMADVLGAELRDNAVPVEGEREGVRVSGLAGLPTFARANSLAQYLFVNGRPVRDKVLLGAVRAAYADLLHGGRYPVVALFITLDPGEVDVNVHPAKTEVRFRDPGLVRGLLVRALKDALGEGARRSATTGATRFSSFARRNGRGANWRGPARACGILRERTGRIRGIRRALGRCQRVRRAARARGIRQPARRGAGAAA